MGISTISLAMFNSYVILPEALDISLHFKTKERPKSSRSQLRAEIRPQKRIWWPPNEWGCSCYVANKNGDSNEHVDFTAGAAQRKIRDQQVFHNKLTEVNIFKSSIGIANLLHLTSLVFTLHRQIFLCMTRSKKTGSKHDLYCQPRPWSLLGLFKWRGEPGKRFSSKSNHYLTDPQWTRVDLHPGWTLRKVDENHLKSPLVLVSTHFCWWRSRVFQLYRPLLAN